jgi:hypothetical protein
VMTGDAMKIDWLQRLVSDQVGRFGHLLEGSGRPSHWHENPAHPRLEHDTRLIDVFWVILVDRCERDDRADSLAFNDPPQRSWPLPGAPDHPPRHNDGNSLLKEVIPTPHEPRRRRQQK